LRVLDHTSLVRDYESVGDLALERVPLIRVPVHLMYAEGSAFLETHDYLLQHLPGARSILLPSTEWGHFGPLEQPEAVVGLLLNVLAPHVGSNGHIATLSRVEEGV
jgi:pimeloyl-ACP methyl ester carboxylesterase